MSYGNRRKPLTRHGERPLMRVHVNADPTLIAVTGHPLVMLHAAARAGTGTKVSDPRIRQIRCRLPQPKEH